MGDMADYANSGLDFGDYLIPTTIRPVRKEVRPVTCKCCGCTGLSWKEVDGKWRMFNGPGMHVCPVTPLPEHKEK